MKKSIFALLFVLVFAMLLVPAGAVFSDDLCDSPPEDEPGNDHPDDSYIVSTLPADPPTVLSDAKLSKLMTGYHKQFTNLLNKINTGFVGTDTGSDVTSLLGTSRLLVIPSGGLYGLDKSEIFKTVLKEFVNQGGVLVVFAQQHGYEYSTLPTPDGEPIQAYGWIEDMSCQYASSYIDTWHQILSGQTNSKPSINVDGYFTSYPTSTTVVLRRTVNGQPSLIVYPYGNGYVIATTIYSDYAAGINQAIGNEKDLVRDIITWATSPQLLPETGRGGTASFNLLVANNTSYEAKKAKVSIYDPNRASVLYTKDFDLSILPDGSDVIPVSFISATTSPLGIYHSTYELFDANGNSIVPETDADSGRFAVSNPPPVSYNSKDFNFAIQSDYESYVYGSDADFTVWMFNNTDQDRTITAKCSEFAQTLTVPAKGKASFIYQWKNINYTARLRMYFYDENGNQIGTAQRGIYAVEASIYANVATNIVENTWNDTAYVTATVTNKITSAYTAKLKIYVYDPQGSILNSSEYTISFTASGTVTQIMPVGLPSAPAMGTYIVKAEVCDNLTNGTITSTNTYFTLEANPLVHSKIPDALTSDMSNMLSFDITNTGGILSYSGSLSLSLTHSTGGTVFDHSQNITALLPGQTQSINFMVNPGEIRPGDYTLTYTLTDSTGIRTSTSKTITSSYVGEALVDKSSYKAGDPVIITLKYTNTGKIQGPATTTVNIPDTGYNSTSGINLITSSTSQVNFDYILPSTISAGEHAVNVTLSTPSGTLLTNSTKLIIDNSKLVIGNIACPSDMGGTITIPVSNIGGVNTTCKADLEIKDVSGKSFYQDSISEIVPVNGSNNIIFQIPGMAEGYYFINLGITDLSTNVYDLKTSQIMLQGLKADLAVSTDKEYYLDTEVVNGLGVVTNLSPDVAGTNYDINNARLVLKAFARKPASWDNPKQSASGYGFIKAIGNEVWLATKTSIIKFDGTNLTIYDSSNTPMPKGVEVTCMEVDTQGNYWFGLFDTGYANSYISGALRYDGHNWNYYNSYNTGYKLTRVNGISKDNSGNLWFAQDSGAVKYDGLTWNKYTTSNTGMPLYYINTVVCDNQGNAWFGTQSSGAVRYDGHNWTNYTTSNSQIKSNTIKKTACDQNGTVYFVTSSNGTSTYNNGTWGSSLVSGNDIYIGSSNKIYISGTDGSVYIYQNGSLVNHYLTAGTPLYSYDENRVAVDDSGKEWFANRSVSRVNRYDGVTWITYDLGMPSNYLVTDLKVDAKGAYWITTDMGVGTYDGAVWNNYYQYPYYYNNTAYLGYMIGTKSIAVDAANNKWIAGGRLYKFDGATWQYYDNAKTGIANFYAQAVLAENNVIWVGTYYNGLCKCDGTTWTVYSTGNSGISSNVVYGIAVDSHGKKWVGTDKGLCVFDGSIWTIYNTTNSGLSSNYVYEVDIDHNDVKWMRAGSVVNSFDGNTWTTYDLAHGNYVNGTTFTSVKSIFIDSYNSKWFGSTTSGAVKYDGNEWALFNQTNSGLLDNKVFCIAEDPSKNAIVFATYKGISKYVEGYDENSPIWQNTVQVNVAESASSSIPAAIGSLSVLGKYFIQADLLSSIGQTLATSTSTFYVTQTNVVLKYASDKEYYKPGSTAVIQGEVQNNSSLDVDNITVKLSAQGKDTNGDILNSVIPLLHPGESYAFTTSIPANSTGMVSLNGSIVQGGKELMSATDSYDVVNPVVDVTVNTPVYADNNQFTISVQLQNTSKVDASVQMSASGSGLSDTQDIVIPAGETRTLEYSQQINSSAIYTFAISGETNQTITRSVQYGLSGSITLGASNVYPEGAVSIPVTIINTGQLDLVTSINYDLMLGGIKTTTIAKEYSIPKDSSIVSNIVFYGVSKGDYQLLAYGSNPTISAQSTFSVKKENDISMITAKGDQTGSAIPITVSLTNNGYNNFSGTLSVDAGFYKSSQTITLDTSSSNLPVVFNMDCSIAAPGNYEVMISLVNHLGQSVLSGSIQVNITGANIAITQLPSYSSVAGGSVGSMTFMLSNSGSLGGQADIRLQALDTLDRTETIWINPGETVDIPFSFGVPEDLETKDYFADYSLTVGDALTAKESGQIKFHIDGIKLDVLGTTDKNKYSDGDTAVLTISVSNLNPGSNYNLFARANYGDYEERQDFTISDNNTLVFNIPLTAVTGEKLFYGIYDETGRSIYLNSLYVYKVDENIDVSLDKQVYKPGEAVTATISSQKTGTLSLTAPGYTGSMDFTGHANISFPFSSPMNSGTYSLEYSLVTPDGNDTISGSKPFDVDGYQVKVQECTTDKGKCSPVDSINTSLTINSNEAIPAVLKTWIVDPLGSYTKVGEENVNLTTDSNLIQTVNVPVNTSSAGIHKLVYAIYDNTGLMLCSGSEAFDVGDAVILGVSTDKAEYPTNTEQVSATINLFGTSSGSLEILIDNNPVLTDVVTLSGFTTQVYNLNNLGVGSHTLTAQLSSDGLISKKETSLVYGADLPDLTITRIAADSIVSTACTVTATLENSGKTASGAAMVGFYDGDPANGGQLIGNNSVGALQTGATQQVSITWDVIGKAGTHSIYVVADSSGSVSEFNEGNNEAFATITIPELIVESSISKNSYNAREDVSVKCQATNLSVYSVDGLNLSTEIINSQGISVFKQTDTVASIASMSVACFISSWRTDVYPPGNFSVRQMLISGNSGQVYSDKTLNFTISPTVDIYGSVALDSQQLLMGQDLTLAYGVTNNGNVSIASGELIAEILTSSTKEEESRQSQILDLDVNVSKTGSITISGIQVAAGDYILRLVVIVNGNEYQIGESTFTILPPLDITKARGNWPRVLCYVKDLPTGPNPAKSAVDSLLTQSGVSYLIVTNPDDMEGAFRSGRYNVYVIVENQDAYQNLAAGLGFEEEEIVETVNSGSGLIFVKTLPDQLPKLKDVLGADFNGKLNPGSYVLSISDSPISASSSINVSTEGVKCDVSSGKVVGTLLSNKTCYPVLITNTYGLGRSVLFAFDAVSTTSSAIKQLLFNALNYVAPTGTTYEVMPLSIQPVTITLQNLGKSMGIKLAGSLPNEVTLIEASGEHTNPPLIWMYDLSDNETRSFNYLLRMPDSKAVLETKSDVSFLDNGHYSVYKTESLALTINRDEMALIGDICASLDSLTLNAKDAGLAANIKGYLFGISSNTANTRAVLDTNISNLLNAIDSLKEMSADTAEIRLDMDRLLMLLQARWSLTK